jgi:hypothetical protein
MNVQGAFNLLLRPGLRKNFLDEWQQYEPVYPQFLKTSSTTEPEQRASIMAGFNRLIERGDGEPITYFSPTMGPQVVGVDKEFAAGYAVSRRAMEDDQYNKMKQGSKWLAQAGRLTMEYRAAALLDDAFAGSTFKGIDNLALISTSHTLLNSASTVANRPSTDIGMSIAGFTAVLDLYQQMKDENYDPIRMWPDTLIVPNTAGDVQRAMQILKSEKEPFTADNQDNPIKARFGSPKLVVNPYRSSSSKAYFLVDSRYNDAHFVTRRAMEFDDTHAFETDAAKFKASCRFLIWFVSWRGWAGANPT